MYLKTTYKAKTGEHCSPLQCNYYNVWQNAFARKYSFFIYADDDYRASRGKTTYAGKSLKELNAEDKKRAEYYKYHTGRVWGDPKNYDCIINTSKMPLEKAADLIINYIKIRQNKI